MPVAGVDTGHVLATKTGQGSARMRPPLSQVVSLGTCQQTTYISAAEMLGIPIAP